MRWYLGDKKGFGEAFRKPKSHKKDVDGAQNWWLTTFSGSSEEWVYADWSVEKSE